MPETAREKAKITNGIEDIVTGDLPRILARTDVPNAPAFPRVPAGAMGAPWATLEQIGAAMREKQKPIDAAAQASQYDIAMEDLKNEVQADPDPNNWRQNFVTQEAQKRTEIMQNIEDPRVKAALNLHIQRSLGRHVIDLSEKGIKASHIKQLGDIETVGNTLAKQAAETSDPGLRQNYLNTYNAMIAGASQPTIIGGKAVPGALNPKEAEKLREGFTTNVLKNRMEMLAVSQEPVDQLKLQDEHGKGIYDRVPPDDRARILERGRSHQETLINKIERDKNEVKKSVYQMWSADANFGQLSDDKITRALKGDDPFITPDQARTLKSINDNPPTGEGGDAVKAIMSQYYGGPKDKGRIAKTRAELNRLQAALGRPNQLIMKGLNEIQGDELQIESVDVQRQNRTITDAKNQVQAERPALPFNLPIFENQRKRDEAKMADDIRKGVDPKVAVDRAVNGAKTKKDAIPDRNKKVLDVR